LDLIDPSDQWIQYLLMDQYNLLDLSNPLHPLIQYHQMDPMDQYIQLILYRQYLLLDLFLMDLLHLFHLSDQ
jgi:hypothetical protein